MDEFNKLEVLHKNDRFWKISENSFGKYPTEYCGKIITNKATRTYNNYAAFVAIDGSIANVINEPTFKQIICPAANHTYDYLKQGPTYNYSAMQFKLSKAMAEQAEYMQQKQAEVERIKAQQKSLYDKAAGRVLSNAVKPLVNLLTSEEKIALMFDDILPGLVLTMTKDEWREFTVKLVAAI